MESRTKNRQDREVIRMLTEKFFPEEQLKDYRELTEGYFNAAYEVNLESGRAVILKIAPPKDVQLMSYEKNIMFSEVDAMRKAAADGLVPVPEIFGFDDSCTICDSPCFFMEKLEGCSLSSCRGKLESEERRNVIRRTGEILRRINSIDCPCFGYPAQPDYQGEEWYPVLRKMFELGISDAKAKQIDVKISTDLLLEWLERDRKLFEEVRTPKLVHWDSWDGNFFVKDGKVTGIIDWERCIWGDPLMEVGFRTYGRFPEFLEGYGMEQLTAAQERRCLWYDVFLLLLVALEHE